MRRNLALIAMLLMSSAVGVWFLVHALGGAVPGQPVLQEAPPSELPATPSAVDQSPTETRVGETSIGSHPDTEKGREALGLGASLRARLVQQGSPMSGLEVEVWWTPTYKAAKLLDRITTTQQGVFRIGGLRAGIYKLTPKGESVPTGWHRRRLRVKAEQDLDLGDLRVPKSASVRGRIVDEKQRPLAKIRVFHAYRQGYSSASFHRGQLLGTEGVSPSVLTDSEGRFDFDRLAPGTHGLLAESLDYADHELSLEVKEGSALDVGTWVLKTGSEIRGRVVDRSGRGVPNARVLPVYSRYEVHRRKGVLTDMAGQFLLKGVVAGTSEVQVEAETYQTTTAQVDREKQSPFTIILDQQFALVGRVQGTDGLGTVVRLKCRGNQPFHVWMILGEDLPVASDGSFRITGLLPGKYSAIAKTPGLGVSKSVEFEFTTGMGPLVLEIRKHHTLEVEVVDSEGKPIEGARVVRDPGIHEFPSLYKQDDPGLPKKILDGWQGKKLEQPKTDSNGKASLLYPLDQPLAVAANSSSYLPVARVYLPGQVPTRLRLVLSKAAKIRGRIEGLAMRHRSAASIRLQPLPSQDKKRPERSSAFDAQGRFQIDQVIPGLYSVGISYFDMTWNDKAGEAGEGTSPILGAGLDPKSVRRIQVAPGVNDEILFELPKLGTISGVVRDVDGPVEGATVFAVRAGYESLDHTFGWTTSLDSPDAHSFKPHLTTGKDGRFRFAFVNSGSWDLRARVADSVVASSPVRVEVKSAGESVALDILLGSASIHGQFDLSGLTTKKKQVSAYLIRSTESGEDPFFFAHHSLPQLSGFKEIKLDESGRFAFSHLPAGSWVLRLTSTGSWTNPLLLQRYLNTDARQRIDLGQLKVPKIHAISVSILPPIESPRQKKQPESQRSPRSYGLWVRHVAAGVKHPIWRTTVPVENGVAAMLLPEGHYQVEIFEAYRGSFSIGISGESTGMFRSIEVRADGSVRPAKIDFR